MRTPGERLRAAADKVNNRCWYCEEQFTKDNPATWDHVVPKSVGGTRSDGAIVCCADCNNARGACPFNLWQNAIAFEVDQARAERRPIRRPKWVMMPSGRYELTTMSRNERREAYRTEELAAKRLAALNDNFNVQHPRK